MLSLGVNYIVSGGAGYLGSHLVTILLEEGHTVIIFDNFSRSTLQLVSASLIYIDIDISQKSAMEDLHLPKKVDGFFHVAGRKSVNESMANPDLYEKVNVIGTQNILDFCIKHEIEAVVLTSSAAVYGSLEKASEISEMDPTHPISPYGMTKLRAEQVLTNYTTNGSIKGMVLRCFNLAGVEDHKLFDFKGENVIPILMDAINNDQPFNIYGESLPTPDGTCVRDYVHVKDVAIAHSKAMEKLMSAPLGYIETLNISSKMGTSMLNLIQEFEHMIGHSVKYRFVAPRKGDVYFSVGDNSKATDLLKWIPTYGINRIVEDSWRANLSNLPSQDRSE